MVKRVLSIDWDYFQNSTPEQIHQFPDGIDINSVELSTIIWSSHYAYWRDKTTKRLEDIKLNRSLLINARKIINEQDPVETICFIQESHLELYRIIHEVYPDDTIDLVNIDLHHDMFTNMVEDEVNCGNWIIHLHNEGKLDQVTWYNRKASLLAYDLKEVDKCIITDSLKDLMGQKFDMIFICKSSTWSPPHFDNSFLNLAKMCIAKFCECIYDRKALIIRNYKPLADQLINASKHWEANKTLS